MKDNSIFQGRRDRSRIDVDDPVDVAYIRHQFPWLSQEQIEEVIRKYGPDRDRVESALEKAGSREDGQ